MSSIEAKIVQHTTVASFIVINCFCGEYPVKQVGRQGASERPPRSPDF